jgi:epoxyqueuosine reductase QueG
VWDRPALIDLVRMPDDVLNAALRGSAMRRTKAAGVRRNVAIALENAESART